MLVVIGGIDDDDDGDGKAGAVGSW